MKRIFILIIISLLLFPCVVKAKEYCKVVSGDGHSLGSEIACGSEHFYIIESNDNEIKMLAKYNLNTGVTIYKDKIVKEDGDTRSDNDYCQDLAASKGGIVKSDGFYNAPGYCFYAVNNIDYVYSESFSLDENVSTYSEAYDICTEKIMDSDSTYISWGDYHSNDGQVICHPYVLSSPILQSEEAKSAHWDAELNYLYPQVGDVYIPSNYGTRYNYPIQEQSNFYDYDVKTSENSFAGTARINTVVREYELELKRMGFEVENVSMFPLSKLDDLIYRFSNEHLPLLDWENYPISDRDNQQSMTFGNLKPYIPEEYSWLYSTTYWNQSLFKNNDVYGGGYYIFTAEQGKLCGAGFDACAPETTLGCGVRPYITISNEIKYSIDVDKDDNGDVEVVDSSLSGGEVSFKVKPKSGYKLASLVLKKANGEVIEISSDDLIENEDGTVTTLNHFVMPKENVIITVRWVVSDTFINPQTRNVFFIIFCFIAISCSIFGLHYIKKQRV